MVSNIYPIHLTPSLRQAAADKRLMDLEVRITKFLKKYTDSMIANDTWESSDRPLLLKFEARTIKETIEDIQKYSKWLNQSVKDEKLDDFRLKMSAAFLTYEL